jgi:hypothetical protein
MAARPAARISAIITRGFLGRQVEHEQTIHARNRSFIYKALQPKVMHQVEVEVKDDGDLRFLPDRSDRFEYLGGRGAGFQAALGGELVHEPVRQGITERHAQLEHVHADAIEGQGELSRGFEVRIAGAEVDHQALAASLAQVAEAFGDAIHGARLTPAGRKLKRGKTRIVS